jgi:microcystin-dependent protein
MFAGNFAPVGWMLCQGQLLPISENETLFNLIGTTYGGDGQSTFALPDLQGRVPVHADSSTYQLGQSGGVEEVTLTLPQVPSHTHSAAVVNGAATATSPTGNVWATGTSTPFSNLPATTTFNAAAVQQAGGSQPHDNMMPAVAVNFIISLFGVFPSPT